MKEDTMESIKRVVLADETVSPGMCEAILRTAGLSVPKRNLIDAWTAQEILDVSRATLRSYVKNGLLTQINISSRKVMFDEDEVRRLAYEGMFALAEWRRFYTQSVKFSGK